MQQGFQGLQIGRRSIIKRFKTTIKTIFINLGGIMVNINLYRLVSHDSSYADVLVNAPDEQEARFLAAKTLINTIAISSDSPKNPFDNDQTDFYQHPSNASCIKLLEGIDYKLLVTYGDFVAIAIVEQTIYLRKGWTH